MRRLWKLLFGKRIRDRDEEVWYLLLHDGSSVSSFDGIPDSFFESVDGARKVPATWQEARRWLLGRWTPVSKYTLKLEA